jgi:putative transcriptional regulator
MRIGRGGESAIRSLRVGGALLGLLLVTLAASPKAAGPATGGAPPVDNLTGQFLVATEELRDPRFVRSVVYVIRHGDGGAMGLVVNRPVGSGPIIEVLKQLHLDVSGVRGDIQVYYGGPVEPGLGFILHTSDYHISSTIPIQGDIALTADPKILGDIGRGAGPRRSLFAMGYAGWSPGQLEGEIAAGHWEVVPADERLLFDAPDDTKWERAMARRTLRL